MGGPLCMLIGCFARRGGDLPSQGKVAIACIRTRRSQRSSVCDWQARLYNCGRNIEQNAASVQCSEMARPIFTAQSRARAENERLLLVPRSLPATFGSPRAAQRGRGAADQPNPSSLEMCPSTVGTYYRTVNLCSMVAYCGLEYPALR